MTEEYDGRGLSLGNTVLYRTLPPPLRTFNLNTITNITTSKTSQKPLSTEHTLHLSLFSRNFRFIDFSTSYYLFLSPRIAYCNCVGSDSGWRQWSGPELALARLTTKTVSVTASDSI